jgi:carbon-monoxide dehydrogenase small subunit
MTVDGKAHVAEVEPRLLLLHHLRENLGIGGVHTGCNTTSCGACTIHMNGESVKSCTVLAVQADGYEVTTVRGIMDNGLWHPMQQAFTRRTGSSAGTARPA